MADPQTAAASRPQRGEGGAEGRGRVRPLKALALAASAFGLYALLVSAAIQDWTADEPWHMQWSRRLMYERVTERETTPLYNSKSPIMIPNVLAKDLARRLGVEGHRPLSFAARLPGAAWYLGLLGALYLLGRRWFGEAAASLAVIATALDPTVIANGAVATVDIPFGFATVVWLGALLGYASRPSARRAAVFGVALGLALVAKFTAVLFIPASLIVLAVWAWRGGGVGRTPLRLLGDSAVAAAVSAALVSAAYLMVEFAAPLSAAGWRSPPFQALAAMVPGLRLPLPLDFLTGIDMCFSHERTREWQVLILGEQRDDGVWWYFLVSWLFKTPLLAAIAIAAGLVLLLRGGRLRADPVSLAIAAVAAVLLGYFSLLFRTQVGYRYVLMEIPLLALLAAVGWADRVSPRRLALGAAAVALWGVGASVPYLGNHLAFTSILIWPKHQAFRYVADSSIDWGQNALKLGDWVEQHRAFYQPLHVEPAHIRPGWNAIDLNRALGAGQPGLHDWLRAHIPPSGHVRHTTLLFHVGPDDYQRFLDEDRSVDAQPHAEARCRDPVLEIPIDPSAGGPFPDPPRRSDAWWVCVESEGVDLGLRVTGGFPVLGRVGDRFRGWDRLWPGQEAWYRLAPGLQVLGLARTRGATASWAVRGGGVRLSLVPARLLPGGYAGAWTPPAAPAAQLSSPCCRSRPAVMRAASSPFP